MSVVEFAPRTREIVPEAFRDDADDLANEVLKLALELRDLQRAKRADYLAEMQHVAGKMAERAVEIGTRSHILSSHIARHRRREPRIKP